MRSTRYRAKAFSDPKVLHTEALLRQVNRVVARSPAVVQHRVVEARARARERRRAGLASSRPPPRHTKAFCFGPRVAFARPLHSVSNSYPRPPQPRNRKPSISFFSRVSNLSRRKKFYVFLLETCFKLHSHPKLPTYSILEVTLAQNSRAKIPARSDRIRRERERERESALVGQRDGGLR